MNEREIETMLRLLIEGLETIRDALQIPLFEYQCRLEEEKYLDPFTRKESENE